MKRDSLMKPLNMDMSTDPNRRRSSVATIRHSVTSQASVFQMQAQIDQKVERGLELMWKRQFVEAAEVLENCLELLQQPVRQLVRQRQQSLISIGEVHQKTNGSLISISEEVRPNENVQAEAEDQESPRLSSKRAPCDAGQAIQTLLLVYSRAHEWQKCYDCAQSALSQESKFNIPDPAVVLDITLRRGVALSHLAGPPDDDPHRLADEEMLSQAEMDFLKVQKTRPNDDAVRRGLQHIAFLKTQSKARVPQPSPLGTEEVTGLARLRAMEA